MCLAVLLIVGRCLYIICPKFSVPFVRGQGAVPGWTDAGCLCWHRSNLVPTSAALGQRISALDSLRAGLADLPDDWLSASPCDAAAVITCEPKSRKVQLWLV